MSTGSNTTPTQSTTLELTEKFFGYDQDDRESFQAWERAVPYGALYRHPIVKPSPLTSDGKKDKDGSEKLLSPAEKEDRETGNDICRQIPDPGDVPRNRTIQAVLASRALPCLLATENQSRRPVSRSSDIRCREYPVKIVAWRDHTDTVVKFLPERDLNKPVPDTFLACLAQTRERGDESTEAAYLTDTVLNGLRLPFGLVTEASGKPDAVIVDPEDDRRVLVCVEMKSTHNLRMPESVDAVVDAYAANDWRTTHPIGQLARQLLLNNCVFGIITSGTRTYFVYVVVIRNSDGYKEVAFHVSRRWYVGEKEYLRAWAWIADEAKKEDKKMRQPNALRCGGRGWHKFVEGDENTTDSPSKGGPQTGGSRGGPQSPAKRPKTGDDGRVADASATPWEQPNALGVLEVDSDDVELLLDRSLGSGRNGSVVEARWRGRLVAVKQFDLDHDDGPHFQREIEAYAALRPLQGEAVARLLFVSRSWCGTLRLMGLELGTPVVGDEKNLSAEWARVHRALEQAGWSQPYEERRVENHVWQDDGKLVAIDLELLERKGPSR